MTLFSQKQKALLQDNPPKTSIRTRRRGQRDLAYLEGWFVLSEANRIFGFDRWSRETIEARCLSAREAKGALNAVYVAKVRIIVHGSRYNIIREAHGTGEANGGTLGEVHELALKTAETDATKRALATFGNPFGLSLYCSRIEGEGVEAKTSAPISHEKIKAIEPIESRAVLIPKLRRIRNRNHLQFVASKACLVCGRLPSDAHHLKFSQPSALSMKVSDEFTVPLCRGHHRELHRSGNERAWWQALKIDPLPVAQMLFRESGAQA